MTAVPYEAQGFLLVVVHEHQALAAYTRGSAFVNGLDAVIGDIAPGKLADLVVLDRDPFAPDVALYEVAADLVFVGGALVHERVGAAVM